MAGERSYQVRRATPTDCESVLQLMRRSFFRDEPLNVAVGLLGEDATCPELENYCQETLAEGMGQLTGALLASRVKVVRHFMWNAEEEVIWDI
jgi:hypothetical protein